MFAAMLTLCCTHCPLSLSWYQCFVPPKFRLPHYSLAMCQCSHLCWETTAQSCYLLHILLPNGSFYSSRADLVLWRVDSTCVFALGVICCF